jgi:hypothetical protein
LHCAYVSWFAALGGRRFAVTIYAVVDAILQDHFNVGSGAGFVLGPLAGRSSQATGLRQVAGRILVSMFLTKGSNGTSQDVVK